MKFNRLFGLIVITSLLLAVFAFSSKAQRGPIEIKFALHTSPPGPEFDAVEKFKELVESRSNRRLRVSFFPGAMLGGERDNIEQLSVGEVHMTLNGDLLASLLAPELAPTVVPFVFPDAEAVMDYWNGPMGAQLKNAIEAKGGIKVVGLMRRGDRHLTANRPVRTPEDLRGLKLRVPEIRTWVRVWRELGAMPTPVAWPEVFSALQMGVVEGQENPFFNIHQAKLFEVQKYLILTGHLPNMWHWALSKGFYDRLSPDLQQIVLEAAAEASAYGDQITKDQIDAAGQLLEQLGMQVIRPDRDAFWAKARPAIEELSREWAPGVFEAVKQYFE